MKSILFSRRRGVSAKVSGSGAPAINAPSGLSIVLIGTTATIGWTNNAGSSAQTSIEHSLNGTSGWAETVLTAAAAQTADVTGLTAGPHYFRLRAKVGTDYSAYAVQTLGATVVFDVANFAASVSGTTVNLSWDAHNAGLAQTVIERSENSGATWSVLATVAAGANTYGSTGNSSGAYLYRARALIGTIYSSAYTASASVTVISAPSSFAASVSGSTITLAWTDTNSGAAQTVIERSTDSGATWSTLTTVAAGTNSYANSGLPDGSYSYRARALIGSTYSNYTSATAGTVAAGSSSLTITGTGFGSSPGVAPFFVQKFAANNGSSDASLAGYAAAQGAFGTNSYGSTMTINTSAGRGGRGALVLSMNFTPGGDRDFFPHVAVDTSNRGRGSLNSQTLYYAYWVRLNRTSGTDATTYQIKGPRAGYASSPSANYYNAQPIYKVSHWAKGDGTYAYTYQEVVPTSGAYDNSEHFNFDSPAWRPYGWNFVEGYMKFNDIGSANGVYIQRINGVDLNVGYPNSGNSRAITARVSGEASKLFNFIFLTPGIDCPSTSAAVGLTLSFSEHYVDTTPQRVVMANHASSPYSASIWTIQEWDSWSNTSIHIPTLDFTGFASGATVYLHVFDASNTLVKSQSITVP